MQHKKSFSLALTLCIAISGFVGCSFFEPHKVPVVQGSWTDAKNIDQLALGMNKEQVNFLLGTPMVIDVFTSDRWIYLYNERVDTKILRERRLQLDFENDELVRIEKTLPVIQPRIPANQS